MVGSTTATGLNDKVDEATFLAIRQFDEHEDKKISVTIRNAADCSVAERSAEEKQKGRGRFPDS